MAPLPTPFLSHYFGSLFTWLYSPSDIIILKLRHLNILYKSYSADLKFGVPSDIMLDDICI